MHGARFCARPPVSPAFSTLSLIPGNLPPISFDSPALAALRSPEPACAAPLPSARFHKLLWRYGPAGLPAGFRSPRPLPRLISRAAPLQGPSGCQPLRQRVSPASPAKLAAFDFPGFARDAEKTCRPLRPRRLFRDSIPSAHVFGSVAPLPALSPSAAVSNPRIRRWRLAIPARQACIPAMRFSLQRLPTFTGHQ
jgi:hypothetical protein